MQHPDPARFTVHNASTYRNYGCRCEVCRRANADLQAEGNAKRAAKPVPDDIHGKASTYQNWGCRCKACKEASRVERRRIRAL